MGRLILFVPTCFIEDERAGRQAVTHTGHPRTHARSAFLRGFTLLQLAREGEHNEGFWPYQLVAKQRITTRRTREPQQAKSLSWCVL